MLWYVNDLMKDATDFSWGIAKAAHTVLLWEMERGTVTWAKAGSGMLTLKKHNHFAK